MKKIIFILFICLVVTFILSGNDEINQTGRMPPFDFFELIDVEVYSPNIVYTFGMGGLFFLDISPPGNPLLLGIFPIGGIYNRFYNCKAFDTLALAAARFSGLYFIDISNISNPQLHKIHKSLSYSYESVDTYTHYAYAAVHKDGVEVIDIQYPELPKSLETLSGFDNVWDVFVKDQHLFVADGLQGLQIYSLQHPEQPRFLSRIETSGYAREVFVENQLAFVALGSAGFDIIDVSDPVNPVFLSNYNNGFGITNHLSYADNFVFTATWEIINAVDVSNPLNPILTATENTPIRAMGVASQGNEIYVADWFSMRIYDFEPFTTPDIHIKPSNFDFGFKGIGQSSTRYVEVYNLGESDLTVSEMSINSNRFTITPASFVVPPNSMDSVEITFIPEEKVELYKTIKIFSNDVDENLIQIHIHAGNENLTPGDTAPEILLNDFYDIPHRLSDYRGKVVLLSFFASW